MTDNQFGTLFGFTSFGESHGKAIGCVVDGVPPNLAVTEADIQPYLDRRKPGQNRFVTQRREADEVEILSGTFEGRTTGTPICLLIKNTDQRSKDYGEIAHQFRPGHADYTYLQKYGVRDYRGGGRSSARETAVRVAARCYCRYCPEIYSGRRIWHICVCCAIGTHQIDPANFNRTQIDQNPFFCGDAKAANHGKAILTRYAKLVRQQAQ